jgi:hypothetical protein
MVEDGERRVEQRIIGVLKISCSLACGPAGEEEVDTYKLNASKATCLALDRLVKDLVSQIGDAITAISGPIEVRNSRTHS